MNKVVKRWVTKFGHAFRGLRVAVIGQDSFVVHFVMTALVLLAAVVLNVSLIEWAVLVLCIGLVLAAELCNTALEQLAKAVTPDFDERVRDCLDIASAAVLIAALAACVVGATIFVFRLGIWAGWWAEYLLL